MSSEFPGNSQRKRDRPAPANRIEDRAVKKIERVVEGEVIRRKKPLRRRFANIFMGGDARSAWQFVALDVLLPAAKDMLADAVSQGFERMIYGEARSHSRRTGRRPGEPRYNYHDRFASGRDRGRDEVRISRRARANHDFDEIILPTRVEAEEVIDQMFAIVEKYEIVTVADLYQLVGISSDYTDDKYGWEDLRGAGVTRIQGGYLLDLPRPEPLN